MGCTDTGLGKGKRGRSKARIKECVDYLTVTTEMDKGDACEFVNLILDLAIAETREELAERDAKASEARAHKEEDKTVREALAKIRAETVKAVEAMPPKDEAKAAPEPAHRINKFKPTWHDPAPAPTAHVSCPHYRVRFSADVPEHACIKPFGDPSQCQGCPKSVVWCERPEPVKPSDTGWYNPAPEPEASKASKAAMYDWAPTVPCKLVDPFNPAYHPAPFAACSHCGDAMMFAEAIGFGACVRCRWFAMLPKPGEDPRELRCKPSAKPEPAPEPDVAPQGGDAPAPDREPATCPECGTARQGVTGIHWRSWYCTPCGKVTTRA